MQTEQLVPATHSLSEYGSKRLSVSLASTSKEIEEAQRLRWLVFRNEMGARLAGEDGIDRDVFDGFCDHLIVRDLGNDMVVGTYRILSPEKAAQLGRYYSEAEFDLSRLHHLRGKTVEVGRSCVHPDYRTGGAINHHSRLVKGGVGRARRRGKRQQQPLASGRRTDFTQPYLLARHHRVEFAAAQPIHRQG